MNTSMQIRDGIETPILLKQGIEVKALILNTDGNTNEAFLLDGVSDEWAAKLPTESFLKLGPKRFITTKPINTLSWESIFPGVQTQYTQPSAVKAPKAGKTIDVPPNVKDVIESLTDDHLKALILESGDQSYVASYDVYRFSAAQGHIEKTFVPTILEAAGQLVLKDRPHDISVISFMNKVYRLTGSSSFLEVDTVAVFNKIEEVDGFEDESLTGALPAFLSKTSRLYCQVNKESYQVISFNLANKSLSFNNFDGLGACYRFCYSEGFTLGCSESQMSSFNAHYQAYKEKNLLSTSFDEEDYIKSQVGQITTPDNKRLIKESINGRQLFSWVCSKARLLQKFQNGKVQSSVLPVEYWLNKLSISDDNIRYLVWGAERPTEGVEEGNDKSQTLILPEITLPSGAKWDSRIRRRSLLSGILADRLYRIGQNHSLAEKIILSHFYELVRSGFEENIQNLDSVIRFLSSVEFVLQVIADCSNEQLGELCDEVSHKLVALGVFKDIKSVGVKDTVSEIGEELFANLQCSNLQSKQSFLRMFLDKHYQRTSMEPKMSMNWPIEQHWWIHGFDIEWSSEGWIASRNGHPVIIGNKSKQDVSEALLKRVIPMRISPTGESYRYYSQKWISYPLESQRIDFPVWSTINIFHDRPLKKKPVWTQSEVPVVELINEFQSDLSYSFESYVSGALEDLANVCGVGMDTLNINGELSIHVTGDESNPQIMMWTTKSMVYCSLGGFANAWGTLFYDSLVGSKSEGIYFPDSSEPKVKQLLDKLALTKKVSHVPTALFDFDTQVRDKLKKTFNIELDSQISQLSESEAAQLLLKLGSFDREVVRETISGIQVIRKNAKRGKWSETESFNDYIKANIEYAQLTGDRTLIQGRSLFGRMFEAWCEDSFRSVPNHFLVYGTLNEDRMGVDVYPSGIDRYKVNTAFDEFFG